ncbi:hypothetical protein V6Z11_D07G024200 [Gossypium hirsutum]
MHFGSYYLLFKFSKEKKFLLKFGGGYRKLECSFYG